jgi:hypothetical protein
VAPLLRQAPARSSGKARVGRRSASTGRSRGLAIRRARFVDAPCRADLSALQVGEQIGRFLTEAHRRQAETDLAIIAARDRRECHVGGAGLCTRRLREMGAPARRGHRQLLELMALRPRRRWVEQRAADQDGLLRVQSWTRRLAVLESVDLSAQTVSGGSGADVEIRRARMPLPSPVDCRPHSGQICCGSVHAQDFDAAPFTWFPSRDSMLISVGSFSPLISAGMADLSRGKS